MFKSLMLFFVSTLVIYGKTCETDAPEKVSIDNHEDGIADILFEVPLNDLNAKNQYYLVIKKTPFGKETTDVSKNLVTPLNSSRQFKYTMNVRGAPTGGVFGVRTPPEIFRRHLYENPSASANSENSSENHLVELSRPETENASGQCNPYDIANFINTKLTNTKKKEVFEKLWTPPEDFIYPSSGKRNLKFQHAWLRKWKWLAYSKKVDGVFCKFCVLFNRRTNVGVGNHQKLGQLNSEKFNNWKNSIERFNEHQQYLYHQQNVENADIILKIVDGLQDPINLQINQEAKRQIVENRNKLKPIIETVLFCGRQSLALRGHRDGGRIVEGSNENEGNFRELLRYRAKHDTNLSQVLSNSKSNALYTSWKIQNEIIEICNCLILEELVKKIHMSSYFSVLADETTDIAGIEQMSLCIRCLDSELSNVEELFLQFVPLDNVTGKGISTAIINELKSIGLNINMLRGQGYDGAAAMSGKFNGVQAHIHALYPEALYVHCAAHSLNLAVSNSCEISAIRNCLGTIGKLYDFFNTPKRQSVLKQCIEEAEINSGHEKLVKLCATRWVERYNSVAVFLELYDAIVLALDNILEWSDKDSANTANQLNCTIKKAEFVISLEVINQVFSYSIVLCKLLQQRGIDLKKATNLAEDTLSEIKKVRENGNSEFHNLFIKAQKKSEKFDFSLNKPRTATHQTKRCNVDVANSEDYYRIAIYIPFLDTFINNLSERFSKHKEVLFGFQSLIPNDPTKLTEENLKEFQYLVSFYKKDLHGSLEELTAEFKLWYRTLSRLKKEEYPKNALCALKHCTKDIYPNIKTLLHILAVLPVSTAENERTFSTLRRMKTYLRNSISETRLNGLALLHVYRTMTPSVELILNKMAEKPRKININLN